VIEAALRPWNQRRMWGQLGFAATGSVVGWVSFAIVIALLSSTAGQLIILPLGVLWAWLLFWVSERLGRLERFRLRVFLGVEVGSPHGPPPRVNPWRRLLARSREASRWKEILYLVVHPFVATVGLVILGVVWFTSLRLVFRTVLALVGDSTGVGWVHPWIGLGSGYVIGTIGLLIVAPWLTLGMANLNVAMARALLGPGLGEQLEKAETQRSAAVESAEAERRRIERDLHDGAQQRLVALAMDLGRAIERHDSDPQAAWNLVAGAHEEAKAALSDLRDLVRGIHPAILEDRGLDAALSAVVARSAVPVSLKIAVGGRLPAALESTAYFVVSECLVNVNRHARATAAVVTVQRLSGYVFVQVLDDGIGGAGLGTGSGLAGLADRVSALGGTFGVSSPLGGPTSIAAEIPCA
jgi:signal transduction histidine kinase